MYRKLKTKHLIAVFIILLVVFALVELKDKFRNDRSLRAQVITVDTSEIAGIVISSIQPAQTVEL